MTHKSDVATLTNALVAFPADVAVQEAGWLALCTAVQSDEHRGSAAAAGALEAAVAALRAHVGLATITQWVPRALFALVHGHAANAQRAGAAGALAAVVAAMQANPAHADLQVYSCQCLGSLVLGCADNKPLALAAGVAEALNAAAAHANPVVQRNAAHALQQLAR